MRKQTGTRDPAPRLKWHIVRAAAQMIWRVKDLTVWDDEVLSAGMVGRRKGVQRMK